MKNGRMLFPLTAMLLAVTVPLSKRGANVVLRPPAMTTPHVVADSLPVPWGKKPGGASIQAAPVVADSLPVPWGKKPGGSQS
jgi:hypothetical protein